MDYLRQKNARMVLEERGGMHGGGKETPNEGKSKYGQPSVMDKYRKKPMSDKEREFRQAGGIEMLAHKARGIHQSDKDWLGPPPTNDWADTGYQAAATVFRETLPKNVRKRIDKAVGREVINQRQSQMHMGEPSSYRARQNKKLFGFYTSRVPKGFREPSPYSEPKYHPPLIEKKELVAEKMEVEKEEKQIRRWNKKSHGSSILTKK